MASFAPPTTFARYYTHEQLLKCFMKVISNKKKLAKFSIVQYYVAQPPLDKDEPFDQLKNGERTNYLYKCRAGDTLQTIAEFFQCSVEGLASVNNFRADTILKGGTIVHMYGEHRVQMEALVPQYHGLCDQRDEDLSITKFSCSSYLAGKEFIKQFAVFACENLGACMRIHEGYESKCVTTTEMLNHYADKAWQDFDRNAGVARRDELILNVISYNKGPVENTELYAYKKGADVYSYWTNGFWAYRSGPYCNIPGSSHPLETYEVLEREDEERDSDECWFYEAVAGPEEPEEPEEYVERVGVTINCNLHKRVAPGAPKPLRRSKRRRMQ
jgi:hypothetical protein